MLTLAAAEEEEGEEKKNGNDERRWRFASSRGMQSEALSALTHSLFRSRSALLRARVCRPLLSKGEETVQRRKRRTDEREREALSMDCLQQKERDSGASRAALEEEEKKSEKKERKKKKKHSRLGEKKEPPRRSKSAFAQMGRGDRPELTAPPEVFYNDEEARKYTTNSRMIEIQVRQGEEWKSIRRRRRRRRLALNLDNLKKKKLKNRPPSPPAPSSSSTSRRTASAASCWTWAAAAASPATPSRTRATSGSEWTSRRRCSASPSSAA